jgi:hypothetical protein
MEGEVTAYADRCQQSDNQYIPTNEECKNSRLTEQPTAALGSTGFIRNVLIANASSLKTPPYDTAGLSREVMPLMAHPGRPENSSPCPA